MTPDDFIAWGCAILFVAGMAGLMGAFLVGLWKGMRDG